jgi:hypothetical protein
MSSNNVALNNGQQAIINTDLSKIFIWNNRYSKATYTNSTYAPLTLAAGTVMGRISANQQIIPLKSAATDGSQTPVGILANDITVADGASAEVAFCVSGDVAEEKLIFQGSDTLNTVVGTRILRDHIGGATVGIKLVAGTELTGYDNQ